MSLLVGDRAVGIGAYGAARVRFTGSPGDASPALLAGKAVTARLRGADLPAGALNFAHGDAGEERERTQRLHENRPPSIDPIDSHCHVNSDNEDTS